MQLEQIFSLARKKWGGNGSGSTPQKTQKLIAAVAPLLAELEVKSVLDLGCGSPPWLATVAHAAGARYVGVDVVGEVVEGNRKLDLPDAEFLKLEESTVLPICDLVFCRDVMPHLSTDNVLALLRRIKQSGATYLLTSHYRGAGRSSIRDGSFRPLNLRQPPFLLPEPKSSVHEGDGAKNMSLWELRFVLPDVAAPPRPEAATLPPPAQVETPETPALRPLSY